MGQGKEDGVTGFGNLYSLIYYHLAKEMVDSFGEKGEEALRRGIRNYGEDRARLLRKRHEEKGLPINVQTLFEEYDLPSDQRFERNKIRLDPETRLSHTLKCPYAEIWAEREEGSRLGKIYCDEFHPAMWEAYHPHIKVELPMTLTNNDPYCDFKVYLQDETSKEES